MEKGRTGMESTSDFVEGNNNKTANLVEQIILLVFSFYTFSHFFHPRTSP